VEGDRGGTAIGDLVKTESQKVMICTIGFTSLGSVGEAKNALIKEAGQKKEKKEEKEKKTKKKNCNRKEVGWNCKSLNVKIGI